MMENVNDTPARLLKLLSLLQTPRVWPGSELAERLGVTDRTVRRDIDRLRALGYPVDAELGAVGGYRLAAGAAMPPLLVDDDEAVAIALGLRAAAASTVAGVGEASVRALTKLEQVLPTRLRRRVRVLSTATSHRISAEPAVDAEVLTTLAAAVTNRERARFTYRDAAGRASARHGEPAGLVASGRRWYLVAYDLDRGDWRTFRADRIENPRATGARFTPRPLPAESPADYAAGARTNWGTPVLPVSVTIHAPVAAVAGPLADAPGELVALDETSCCLTGEGDDAPEWLAHRLIRLGVDFEVHEPRELIEELRVVRERLERALGARRAE